MPSGKKAYPKIEDNKDGTVTIKYQPQETGLHCLHVKYNQTEIQGKLAKTPSIYHAALNMLHHNLSAASMDSC